MISKNRLPQPPKRAISIERPIMLKTNCARQGLIAIAVRQLKVGKSDLRSGINRNAVPSSSPTLPLRLRWELNEIGPINRNAVAPVLNAGEFPLRLDANGHNPFRVGKSSHQAPKVAAAATLGWRTEPLCGCSSEGAGSQIPYRECESHRISATYFQLAHCSNR